MEGFEGMEDMEDMEDMSQDMDDMEDGMLEDRIYRQFFFRESLKAPSLSPSFPSLSSVSFSF